MPRGSVVEAVGICPRAGGGGRCRAGSRVGDAAASATARQRPARRTPRNAQEQEQGGQSRRGRAGKRGVAAGRSARGAAPRARGRRRRRRPSRRLPRWARRARTNARRSRSSRCWRRVRRRRALQAALDALGKLGDAARCCAPTRRPSRSLELYAGHRVPDLRRRAIKALGTVNDPRVDAGVCWRAWATRRPTCAPPPARRWRRATRRRRRRGCSRSLGEGDAGVAGPLAALATPDMVPQIAELAGTVDDGVIADDARRVRQARRRSRQAARRRAAHDRRPVGAVATTALVDYVASVPAKDRPALEEAKRRSCSISAGACHEGASSSAAIARRRRWRRARARSRPPARPARSSGPATRTTWPARSRARVRPAATRGGASRFWSWRGAGGAAARRVRSRRLAPALDPAGRRDHARRGRWHRPRSRQQSGRRPTESWSGATSATGAVLWQHAFRRPTTSTATTSTATRCSWSPARPRTPNKPTGVLAAYDARTGILRWRRCCRRRASPARPCGAAWSRCRCESQYVLLYDGVTGLPLGQVLSTEEAATFVRALPEGLFYGSRGAVPARARHRARLAPRDGLPGARSCRRSCDRSTIRSLPPRAERVLGARSQPRALARHRRRRPSAVPRRSGLRSRLPVLLRLRREVGRASLGLRQPRGRGGLDRHRARRSCS